MVKVYNNGNQNYSKVTKIETMKQKTLDELPLSNYFIYAVTVLVTASEPSRDCNASGIPGDTTRYFYERKRENMNNRKRDNPKPFTPVKGEVYENVAGGKFLCESGWDDEYKRPCGWMINTKTGWSLTAVCIVRYEDGTIEWDYSNGEGFLPIDDRRQQLIARAIQREIDRKAIKAKQNSLLNAMLCCLI